MDLDTGQTQAFGPEEIEQGIAKLQQASELIAHNGITVNMVSPSLTITDLTNDIPARVKEVEAFKNPVRRLVTTIDIASQVVHLCSEDSSYINGVNLPITATPV